MWSSGPRLCATAVAVVLTLGGCGGEDDDPGGTGAQGATGPAGGASEVTAEEFLPKLLPEKESAIEAVVATEPACEGLEAEPALVLVVSDAASKADPETPLVELVVAEC